MIEGSKTSIGFASAGADGWGTITSTIAFEDDGYSITAIAYDSKGKESEPSPNLLLP